jgi:AbiV family abortive infection protein
MALKAETFSRTISACYENGKKLLEDAKLLFEWDRFSTALALSILAQEEFAKTFLLTLVADDALPWLPEVQQSMVKHQCKHLLAIVMEWLPSFDAVDLVMEQTRRNSERHERWMAWSERRSERHEQWMAWSKRRIEKYRQGNRSPDPNDPEPHSLHSPDPNDPEPVEEAFYFPADVATALNIYRREIEKIRSGGHPRMDADWRGKARKIADGLLDRKKQSGFYVDVTKTGEIGQHPGLITREDASEEIKRAARLYEGPITYSDEYKRLKEVLPLIFANLKDTSEER